MNSCFPAGLCVRCSKDVELVSLFASQLASKVRDMLPTNSLIVGILGAGAELSEQMAKMLGLKSQILHIYPIVWPQNSNYVVGAVSGISDVTYIDYKALVGASYSMSALMTQIQAVKIKCMKEAIGKELGISERNWSAITIVLCCCMHAPLQVLEAALQNLALKPSLQTYLSTPFVSREIRIAVKDRVKDLISLGEFDQYDRTTLSSI